MLAWSISNGSEGGLCMKVNQVQSQMYHSIRKGCFLDFIKLGGQIGRKLQLAKRSVYQIDMAVRQKNKDNPWRMPRDVDCPENHSGAIIRYKRQYIIGQITWKQSCKRNGDMKWIPRVIKMDKAQRSAALKLNAPSLALSMPSGFLLCLNNNGASHFSFQLSTGLQRKKWSIFNQFGILEIYFLKGSAF